MAVADLVLTVDAIRSYILSGDSLNESDKRKIYYITHLNPSGAVRHIALAKDMILIEPSEFIGKVAISEFAMQSEPGAGYAETIVFKCESAYAPGVLVGA